MEYNLLSESDVDILELTGEVDLNHSPQLREMILASLNKGSALLVDMAKVSYIDSSGIASLVEGFQTAKSSGQDFGLLQISEPALQVLTLTRLDKIFSLYNDLEQFRARETNWMSTSMPADLNAIEVRDLIVDYGDRRIINGLSLDIPKGEIMVIMGGSGTGKSTLLRCLLGLKAPTAGTIDMLGTELTSASTKDLYALRKQMGVAFQSGALFSSMSVAENIQLTLREHTDLDETTIGIMTRIKLDMVNMLPHEHLMPSELSGGMTKRAALARAIIMDPKLLFFDEPSAGLDPITSAELDELIIMLKESMKMTIVVVTHELDSAFAIADNITILDAGKVLEAGTPESIKSSKNERIQNMLNRKPRDMNVDADEHLRRLAGEG